MRMWTVSVASWLGLLLVVPSSGWGQGFPPTRTPPYSAASSWGPPAIGRLNSATPSYPELPTRVPSSLTGDTSRFVSHSPQYLAEPVPDNAFSSQLFGAVPARPPAQPPERDGIFQKLTVSGTWLAQPDDGDLGSSDVDISVVLGFPMPSRESPLLIRPRFAVQYLDGPIAPDLPSRVYDAAIEWRHLRQLNDRWAMDVSVTTGYYSDFASDNGDAFRLTGRGLGIYTWTPTTKVILGVLYLNRAGASVIPAAGLYVTPSDGVRWELVFPRPRVAWRWESHSIPGIDERWFYVAGEFGGGIWAIERASGANDLVTTRDYRVILGVERKITDGLDQRFEIGYVFGREIEYDSVTPDFKPDDTVMLRYVVVY